MNTTPAQHAKLAGLRFVRDDGPGIGRRRMGKEFRFVDRQGKIVGDEDTLVRIRAMAIPPAWENVWICDDPKGHIQATGRDEKGRKQYRYHPAWRETRDDVKYGRMLAFGKALGKIRRKVNRDLRAKGLPRRKVVAAVVRLLETSLIRVGNDEYAKTNGSYGLTTMRDRHVEVEDTGIKFRFKGKSGVRHKVEVKDKRVAKVVKRCRELPGQELFQYEDDDGDIRDVGSGDVNEYLREATGEEFTAKDFRTWAGTVMAALALKEVEAFGTEAQARKNIVAAVERVAERLGNTPSVCRKCYIHPAVLDAYLEGTMLEALESRVDKELRKDLGNLRAEEAAVLGMLKARLQRERKRDGSRKVDG
jgi:DNA topoisomerase-1